jgi:hypothetical protein
MASRGAARTIVPERHRSYGIGGAGNMRMLVPYRTALELVLTIEGNRKRAQYKFEQFNGANELDRSIPVPRSRWSW